MHTRERGKYYYFARKARKEGAMKKLISLLLVLVLALGLVACASNGDQTGSTTPATSAPSDTGSSNTGSSNTPSDSTDTPDEPAEPAEVTYPLTDGYTFTCWWPSNLAGVGIEDYNDTPIFQYLESKTGVHLEFQNPVGENAGESYNLMLVSGDLADFIRQLYLYHARGMDDLVDSEWIINQMDYMQYTPNLEMRLNANPEAKKQALTDSGYLSGFPMVMSEACPWVNGMMIRKDWLNDLGLEVPKTIAETEKVLAAFEGIDTVIGGLYMNANGFTGLERSFNMVSDFGADGFSSFINKDGTAVASVLTEDYKSYLTTMVDWYAKGYIDPDFVSKASYISIGDMANRLAGTFGLSFDCFVYLDAMNTEGRNTDPDYEFIPIPWPTMDENSTIHTLPSNRLIWQGALGVSTQCDNIELACRYWDYCYSDEGSTYCNFGKYGETWEYGEDGLPHLNDFAKNNPDPNMNLNAVENYYMFLDAPFYRIGYREYDAISDNERTCGDAWTIGDDAYTLPDNMTMTAEEGTLKANIMSDINTFIVENQVQFITGVKPLSEFDSFIEQIKGMGIDQVVAATQAALDRYNARG